MPHATSRRRYAPVTALGLAPVLWVAASLAAVEAGAAITLIDRSVGVFAQGGRAGESDGRIDRLLDRGEYRVRVQAVHEDDEATVNVREFTEVEGNAALLMNSAAGTLHESTLRDHEQKSYWVQVLLDGLPCLPEPPPGRVKLLN